MKLRYAFFALLFAAIIVIPNACRKDEPLLDLDAAQYPDDIGKIMLTKCAVSGCHNDASANGAAGLNLSSWEKMMQGDRNGAVVIPFSHEYSTTFIFCNSFADLGPTGNPLMPYGDDPLTREEVLLLKNWINAGAPSRNGTVAFSGNTNRKKYYVTNQGCDVVTVFDQQTGLPMRYIRVGADAAIESPHAIRLSPDGLYWYACFSSGRYLEKYRTSDDSFVGRILLGANASLAFGSWNTFAITPDGSHAFVIDWSLQGRIAWVDLNSMTCNLVYNTSDFVQTHGSVVSPDGNSLYVTTTTGNFIYKLDITDPTSPSWNKIIIDGVSSMPSNVSSENPHEIIFSPDGSKYFVTSSGTNVIRVLNSANDSLIATIPVGVYPQEFAISTDDPYLYVTCMEDTLTYPGKRGSVFILDWQNNTVIGSVYSGHQPHGIAVDDDKNLVIIANRNFVPGGPAPHHASACGGSNGYVSFLDMSTQTILAGRNIELSVDPYAVLVRP